MLIIVAAERTVDIPVGYGEPVHVASEAELGKAPITLDGFAGNTQRVRRLVCTEVDEKLRFSHVTLRLVNNSEAMQSKIQGYLVRGGSNHHVQVFIGRDLLRVSAALAVVPRPCEVGQDMAHQPRANCVTMVAVPLGYSVTVYMENVDFVDEHTSLPRMVPGLESQVTLQNAV